MMPFIYDEKIFCALITKPEFRRSDIGSGVICYCYMMSDSSTFSSEYYEECRGITFTNGVISSRPLHKFYNVNEKEKTFVRHLDWKSISRVMIKRDGSMVHPVRMPDGSWKIKTKKTFTSEQAVEAHNFAVSDKKLLEFINDCMARNLTPIFEWTAPHNRIVVFYPEKQLTLLHVRHNKTGEYYNRSTLQYLANQYGIPLVEEVSFESYMPDEIQTLSWEKKVEWLHQNVKEIEGWVIQFESGEMVKLKTKWYLDLHHAITMLRERDVAELVLEETIDDFKSKLVTEGIDISEIVTIETNVNNLFKSIIQEVELAYNTYKHLEIRYFVEEVRKGRYASQAITWYNHGFERMEQSVLKLIKQDLLKEMFSLRQINLLPAEKDE